MRLIGEGAEAKVFEVDLFGMRAVAKQRHAKRYRIREIDEMLRKTRTKKEARVIYRAHRSGVTVPRLLGVGQFTIYMEMVEGTMLKDMRDTYSGYADIGKMLAKMHNADVVHGDFTPANIIVGRGRAACVIDFGLSEISASIEDKAIDLLLMKRSIDSKSYAKMLAAYREEAKQAKQILTRLADVEQRGRYQTRTLV